MRRTVDFAVRVLHAAAIVTMFVVTACRQAHAGVVVEHWQATAGIFNWFEDRFGVCSINFPCPLATNSYSSIGAEAWSFQSVGGWNGAQVEADESRGWDERIEAFAGFTIVVRNLVKIQFRSIHSSS
jgi:hypothetical protein